jgi:hypothetical protein
MPRIRLTKSAIDALPTPDTDLVYWDAGCPGFGVKVTPKGRKVFIVLYRTGGAGSKLRKYTIGPYGRVTLHQARVAAQRVFAAKLEGRATINTGSPHDGELLFARLTDANSVCLCVFLAFREEGFLRRTFERFSTAVHRLRFARFLLAFLQKALLRRPRERLAVRADSLAFARLGEHGSDAEDRQKRSEEDTLHIALSISQVSRIWATPYIP